MIYRLKALIILKGSSYFKALENISFIALL